MITTMLMMFVVSYDDDGVANDGSYDGDDTYGGDDCNGRYKEGLADLQQRGWDEEVAMSAMREAAGNSTAALLALEEEDR